MTKIRSNTITSGAPINNCKNSTTHSPPRQLLPGRLTTMQEGSGPSLNYIIKVFDISNQCVTIEI